VSSIQLQSSQHIFLLNRHVLLSRLWTSKHMQICEVKLGSGLVHKIASEMSLCMCEPIKTKIWHWRDVNENPVLGCWVPPSITCAAFLLGCVCPRVCPLLPSLPTNTRISELRDRCTDTSYKEIKIYQEVLGRSNHTFLWYSTDHRRRKNCVWGGGRQTHTTTRWSRKRYNPKKLGVYTDGPTPKSTPTAKWYHEPPFIFSK
jgi:hypothetical protein